MPFPMTRTREPMRSAEASLVLRPRAASDYAALPPACLLRPSVHHIRGRPGSFENRNPAMASVPCIVYAGLWWDPFAVRVPIERHRDGEWIGPLLLALGAIPTALVLAGLAASVCRLFARGAARLEAPLVAATGVGLASFVLFTWRAPSLAAAKASYLLPLAVPAALFFARGVAALPVRLRAVALSLSLAAALASGVVFTEGVVFEPAPSGPLVRHWLRQAARLPEARIGQAVRILEGARPAATRERE
jgi:hypothetical protein